MFAWRSDQSSIYNRSKIYLAHANYNILHDPLGSDRVKNVTVHNVRLNLAVLYQSWRLTTSNEMDLHVGNKLLLVYNKYITCESSHVLPMVYYL